MKVYQLLGEDSRRNYDALVLSLMLRGKNLIGALKMAESSIERGILRTEALSATIIEDVEDTDILMSDGGAASIHFNGEYWITTYYQDRNEDPAKPDWDKLAEGKTYYKDWEDKSVIDDEMIQDAIYWLGGNMYSKIARKEATDES